jgi:hypothetical protein
MPAPFLHARWLEQGSGTVEQGSRTCADLDGRTLPGHCGLVQQESMMKKHILSISVVSALVLAVAILVADQNCQVSTMNAMQAAADAFSENAMPNGRASHCLVYGKYCLSNALRSR